MTPNALLTVREAAEILRVTPKTLYNWHTDRSVNSPPRVKLGSKVMYRHAELHMWINALETTN